MSRRNSGKISTDGGEGLADNPFAGLESSGLPDRPAKPIKHQADRKKSPPKRGRVEVRREKAGRGGKTVTTLSAFATHLPLAELERLTYDLKKTCACGGSLKGRVLELQGDVRERVMDELSKRGFEPVKAGG